MGNERMNERNTDAVERGEINEQHQNVAKLVMQRDPNSTLNHSS